MGTAILNFIIQYGWGSGLLVVFIALLMYIIMELRHIHKLLSNHITDTNKKIDGQKEDFKVVFMDVYKRLDQQREDFNQKFDQQREDFNQKFDQQREDFNQRFVGLEEDLREIRKDIKELIKNQNKQATA